MCEGMWKYFCLIFRVWVRVDCEIYSRVWVRVDCEIYSRVWVRVGVKYSTQKSQLFWSKIRQKYFHIPSHILTFTIMNNKCQDV
jgi:hypothetical protein